MTPKEPFCSQHERLEENIQRIYDKLETKSSNATLRWGIGIFIIVFISISGFFWNQSRIQENRLEANQMLIIHKLEVIKKDMGIAIEPVEKK